MCCYLPSDEMRDSHDERIAHAERTMTIGHADICPTLRKTLQLIKLVRNETTVTPIDFHNVLKAGSPRAALPS